MEKKLISSMEIVRKYKIPYSTFTLYTNLGFFGPAARDGNKRLFAAKKIKARLAKIAKLKKQGYPLRLISKRLRG